MKTISLTFALFLLLPGCKSTPAPSAAPTTAPPEAHANDNSEKAPDFTLAKLKGGSLKSSNIKGKVVIVDFWATNCAPCIKEIPDYNSLYAKYKDKGVEFVGVAVESGTPNDIRRKVKELRINYPVVIGTEEVSQGFGGILGTPTTFVLGKDWTIHHRFFGDPPNKKAAMEKDIQDLLALQ